MRQLANQFIASIYYVNKHHDLQPLAPTDTLRQEKKNEEGSDPEKQDRMSCTVPVGLARKANIVPVDPYSADVFKAGQRELAQDLIIKEQQIEYLISVLPGLENSEKDQEQTIRQLEEELKIAEEERKAALKEKEAVLARLEGVIRSVKRP